MGYLKIPNLYKEQTILMLKEVYALEKIHGTSAHVVFNEGQLGFFSGGEKHDKFVALFDQADLKARFECLGHPKVILFGEAYGGKQQGMSATYGPNLKFVVFDVKIGDTWLAVPDAEEVTKKVGLEFVAYERVPTDLAALDAQRDLPSRQAVRNGIVEPKVSEGVVLRPLVEFSDNRGNRLIVKHKRPEFSERTSKRDTVVDPAKLEVLTKADSIAAEWATPMRLEHVLDKLKGQLGREVQTEDTRSVIDAMVVDIETEGVGEVVMSKEAIKAIGSLTAKLFRKSLMNKLNESAEGRV